MTRQYSESRHPLLIAVGARIKAERQAAGMSQAQLAVAIGMLRTSITNVEAGRQNLPLTTLALIAQALDCAVGDLLPPSEWPSDEQFDGRHG